MHYNLLKHHSLFESVIQYLQSYLKSYFNFTIIYTQTHMPINYYQYCYSYYYCFIIIIIYIIIIISFMQGTYIPETNYVPREHGVAAILLFLFMALTSLLAVLNLLYFYISLLLLLLLLYNMDVSCYRPFLLGTSLEPVVFPYYAWCSKLLLLLLLFEVRHSGNNDARTCACARARARVCVYVWKITVDCGTSKFKTIHTTLYFVFNYWKKCKTHKRSILGIKFIIHCYS